jgi:hypothetical protein
VYFGEFIFVAFSSARIVIYRINQLFDGGLPVSGNMRRSTFGGAHQFMVHRQQPEIMTVNMAFNNSTLRNFQSFIECFYGCSQRFNIGGYSPPLVPGYGLYY